jgi:hypothetical protein
MGRMPDEPTPGQVAHAAFLATLEPPGTTPWHWLGAYEQRAWEAAAQAVLDAFLSSAQRLTPPAPQEETQGDRNAVYHERNMLVAYLATCYPAHLARHPEQEPWDDDWRWLVCVHTPAGQMTWHIHDSEYPLFRWLPAQGNDWDGHTTEEKYTCLLGLIIEKGAHRSHSA